MSLQSQLNPIIDEQFPAQPFKDAAELIARVPNTYGVTCPQCGTKDNAYEETKQTRSADEAETRVLECLTCGYHWRM